MAGAGDQRVLGVREQARDQRPVLGLDVAGARAGDEQGRSGILRIIGWWKTQELRHVGGKRLEVDAPDEAGLGLDQVLQQEIADHWIADRALELQLRVGAPPHRRQVDRRHRLDERPEAMRIGDRGDVDHDQTRHPLGTGQGQAHRDLPAQAVADHGRRSQAVGVDEVLDVAGHGVEAHGPGPGRAAMVAQVEHEDAVALPQLPGDRRPIARRAKEAVQDQDRRTGGAELVVGEVESGQQLILPNAAVAAPVPANFDRPALDCNRAGRGDRPMGTTAAPPLPPARGRSAEARAGRRVSPADGITAEDLREETRPAVGLPVTTVSGAASSRANAGRGRASNGIRARSDGTGGII